MRLLLASETLCRKGGTSRSDNAPHASGARVGAKLACGATLSATRELRMGLGCSVCDFGGNFFYFTGQFLCRVHAKYCGGTTRRAIPLRWATQVDIEMRIIAGFRSAPNSEPWCRLCGRTK